MPAPVRLAGVDGCRGGWVVVETGIRRGTRTTMSVLEHIDPLVARIRAGTLALAAVDMPIGLPGGTPDDVDRACDRAARRRLGPRASSVFPTPARAALGARTFDEALAANRGATGRGLSRQAFHLLAKIAELDAAIDADDQARIVECHPESCFVTLAGRPLAPKRTAVGRAERAAVLRARFDDIDDRLGRRPAGVAADDLLDAFVLADAARRHRLGRALVLGDGRCDERGLRMQIVC